MLIWYTLLVFISILNAFDCKASLSFKLPAVGPFRSFGNKIHFKNYSGKRVKNDSIRMVYFHDQTVAVVELEPDKLLLNCELIEVYEPSDAVKALGDFTEISPPVAISFIEMITLMHQCQQLEDIKNNEEKHDNTNVERQLLTANAFTLFSGIVPGTKWCGSGDIAKDYYDLGKDLELDKCCRMHDLCPVKVRALSNRYNLTNSAFYTKSHCICDDDLYNCLKNTDSPTARILGHIYFNLIEVPCVEDTDQGRTIIKAKKHF